MTRSFLRAVVAVWLFAGGLTFAQYPTLSPQLKAEADARRAASDQRSDEAFARALPLIRDWEARGKPYIPWAARPQDLPQASIPAFPGAWGGGMYSFGGRGGKVYVVTSLEDSGPGTFREALEAAGPRIVVFNVAGIIRLKDRIRIRAPYITIAGNTAPGDGVCIASDTVEIETHDVVIRHMRFRRGNTWVGDRNDSLGGNPVGNIMIDHVSASWGLDENMSIYRHMYQPPEGGRAQKLPTVNLTIQWSISSEGLNTYNHAFGSTLGGRNTLFHHNLYACNTGRNPSIGMTGDFNWVNNVLFNWRHRTMDGAGGGNTVNVINCYYKPGPATPKDQAVGYRIVQREGLDRTDREVRPNFYVEGNIVEGNEKVTADNWAGGVQHMDEDDAARDPEAARRAEANLPRARAKQPLPMPPAPPIDTAAEAFEKVLANAGATLPRRDAVDQRVVEMVRSGKVSARPSMNLVQELGKVGYRDEVIHRIAALIEMGIITDPRDVGGYPQYQGTPCKDSDSDGMPDEWETKYGLNPNDASDAIGDLNGDGYTNIEKFIYNIDPTRTVNWKDLKNNVDTLIALTK